MNEPLQRYKAPQDVYARHLVSHRGYPLWIPELEDQLPEDYQDNGLKIGDVGYVVPEEGCFEVLFNICLPLDHDLHRGKRLPRNFQSVALGKGDIATYRGTEDAGCVISTSSVKIIETNPAEQPSDYKFTLSSSEGALLILPQGADRHSLRRDRLFGKYAMQHAAEWYRFVEEDLERTISYDSLYLITGFYKAPSFALASFQEAEGSADIIAQFKVTQEGDGIIPRYRWSTTPTLNKRVGPQRYNGNANQAVYISGFKIAVRAEPAGRKQILVKVDDPSVQPRREEFSDTMDSQESYEPKKSTEPTQTSRESLMNQGTQRTTGRVSLRYMPQVLPSFHPSDTINRYLLREEPSATVAITHDTQWATLLKSGRLEPHELAEEHLIVKALFEKYVITSQDGSVFLLCAAGAGDTGSPDIKDNLRIPQGASDISEDHDVHWSRDTELITTARPLAQSKQFDSYCPSGTSSDIITSLHTTGRLPHLDESSARLSGDGDIQPASLSLLSSSVATPSLHVSSLQVTCQWATSRNNLPLVCGALLPSDRSATSVHLRDVHGIQKNKRKKVKCLWFDCSAPPMRWESLIRHVREVHWRLHRRIMCGAGGGEVRTEATRGASQQQNPNKKQSHAHVSVSPFSSSSFLPSAFSDNTTVSSLGRENITVPSSLSRNHWYTTYHPSPYSILFDDTPGIPLDNNTLFNDTPVSLDDFFASYGNTSVFALGNSSTPHSGPRDS